MKQMSWLSGLAATASPRARRLLRGSRALVRVAEREHRVRELLLGEHAEHVGLVLGRVGGAVQLDQPVGAGLEPRVVAGDDGVEAERDAAVEDGART